uniref:CEP63/Deup1 N-terminal domain-containing protein n=1 Tax=Canis lupus dingo TaxID=286419 RepID=A0A8C0KTS2_CANLU
MENQAHNTMGASPCEAELQELMEQIDIMVSNKKLDWERKMRALETRLDLRDQELANAQTCLDQKGQEVLNIHVNSDRNHIYSVGICFSLRMLFVR